MSTGAKTPRARTNASIFQELRATHASVDAEDDAISAGLRRFEENLAKVLRVRVATVLSSEPMGAGSHYYRVLAFEKQEAGWRLVIEAGYDHDESGEEHVTPLLSASREVRTQVVAEGHLQKLLESAVTELKKQADQKRQARAALDRLNSDLAAELTSPAEDFGDEP